MPRNLGHDLDNLLGPVTDEKAELLLNGLVSLGGALAALQEPIPPALEELKAGLLGLRRRSTRRPKDGLNTREVAHLLNYTERRVRQLAKDGRIRVIEQGAAGRGRSNLYEEQSVYEYAAARQTKGGTK